MKPICFYHKADLDGVCSGAIVKHFVPDVELVGFDYGEKFPWDKAREGETDWAIVGGEEQIPSIKEKRLVYMVDVSLPPEDMKRLAQVSNLIWIDHHKSAIETCAGFVKGSNRLVHPNFAACELTWAWFNVETTGGDYWEQRMYNPSQALEVVRLLGRYDVWDKDNPEWDTKILPFQYGMRSVPGIYDPSHPEWVVLFGDRDNLLTIGIETGYGERILGYQAEVNRRACETGAHEFDIVMLGWEWVRKDSIDLDFYRKQYKQRSGIDDPNCGFGDNLLRVIACNTIVFNSQFFDGFYDPEKHDVMCAYCRLADGRWKVSLYSTKPEIDCGAICKTFGGGGHKGAAGFVCNKLPWDQEQETGGAE